MTCKSIQRNIKLGKPKWLRRSLPSGPEYEKLRKLLKKSELTTVCQEARCPNQFECFSKGTATFMIMGDRCTRNCRFCAVAHKPRELPDTGEPARIAEAVELLNLRYVVVTSVTRDDLEDGGASCFVKVIEAVKKRSPKTQIELLIPDLQGNWQALEKIIKAEPDVLNHNVETVARLYSGVRPGAVYHRSLELLARSKEFAPHIPTKSGLMLGLGEDLAELRDTWRDLRKVSCDILAMGQYLQPSAEHLEVTRFVAPEEFEELKTDALSFGFSAVAAGPFVRSSYQAEKLQRKTKFAL